MIRYDTDNIGARISEILSSNSYIRVAYLDVERTSIPKGKEQRTE